MSEHDPYKPSQFESTQDDEQNSVEIDWQSKGNLVVLATFDNAPEAHCLRIELENNGIRAAVTNETSAQTVGASLFGRISAIWIEVVVLDSDAEEALKIKNNFLDKSKETDIPEWKCQCGEMVDAGFTQCWSCLSPHPNVK